MGRLGFDNYNDYQTAQNALIDAYIPRDYAIFDQQHAVELLLERDFQAFFDFMDMTWEDQQDFWEDWREAYGLL